MASLKSLDRPLSKEERRKLDELLRNDRLFEKMFDRAIRGRMKAGNKSRKPE